MGVYKYDVEELQDTAAGLRRLHGDFENAAQTRDRADGAFGWSWLEGAVSSFVENWEHNRDKQLEAIQKTHEALSDISETYVAFDQEAVGQLRDASDGGR